MSQLQNSLFSQKEAKSWKRPWHPGVPLLNACVLFILIRALNDIPSGSNYLSHSSGFILLEIICTILFSYICVYLTYRWVGIVMTRKIPAWIEYGWPISLVALTVSGIILVSHSFEDESVSLGILLPPLFVAVAGEILVYSWIKTSETERELHETQLNRERVINSQLKTEMKLLQLQFHPHFLFNMLNTIYFTISDDNIEAKSSVEHLSNLLRGQLYSTDGKVPLSKEISTLNSYIYLVSWRLEDQKVMDLQIPDVEADPDIYSGFSIYPHLLLPLVENVFKHARPDRTMSISLRVEDGWLKLHTSNSLDDTTAPAEDNDHGIGLSNLTQRLALIYSPEDYEFHAGEAGGMFNARLYLRL